MMALAMMMLSLVLPAGSAVLASDCSDLLGNLAAERHPTRLRHGIYVNAISWSHDGARLATLDQREHSLYVWQMPEGRLIYKAAVTSGILHGLTFSADGRFIFTSGFEKTTEVAFEVRDAETGEKLRDVKGPPREPRDGNNNALMLLASPDSKHLIALHSGGAMFSVYDAATWELEKAVRFRQRVKYTAAISPDGKRVAFGGGYGNVEVFSFPELEPLKSFQAELGTPDIGPVESISFSPDGKIMAVGSLTNIDQPSRQLRLWDTDTLQLLREYDTSPRDRVEELAYSPDGKYIATSSLGRINLWDSNSKTRLGEFRVSSSQPVVYAYDGHALAFGDAEYVDVCRVSNSR